MRAILAVLALAVAAPAIAQDRDPGTVNWYLGDQRELQRGIAWCNNNPGDRVYHGRCYNVREAQTQRNLHEALQLYAGKPQKR